MLWLKTFNEAVGLPKLNGVAINGDFCEPPRLFLIGRSCCLLHCDRHTAHGGRNFSADPGTTEL
jgi:hypothetical protein